MTGSIQRNAWFDQWRRDGKPDTWKAQFVRAGRYSNRVRCKDCGSKGIPGLDYPNAWQIGCLIGHRDKCEHCGSPTNNLYQHQHCKLGHTTCCKHTDTQYRALVAILEGS